MSESNSKFRPILSVGIRPKVSSDGERLQQALDAITGRHSGVRIVPESADGSIRIAGMSESHLLSTCEEIVCEYQLQMEISEPEVLYLETIRRRAEGEGKYIRQTGGSGNYGHCKLRIEPNEPGKGYEFINEIKGGVVPKQYIKSIDDGIQGAMEIGVLAGHPMVDIKVTLFGGSYHEVDSNEMAFKFASSMAFKDAARRASPVLLEPVMAVEVTVPEDLMGLIIGDINSRRGRIDGVFHAAGSQVIKAMVPLKEMFGYVNDVHSSTQGRGSCSVQFSKYEPARRNGLHGDDASGVPARRPQLPTLGRGSAAASLAPEVD